MEKLLKDPKFAIILLQCTAVFLIILSVLTVKAFGGNIYSEFGNWYRANFETNTTIDEVLKDNDFENETEKNEPQVVITNTTPQGLDTKLDKTEENSEKTEKNEVLNTMPWPVEGFITSEFGGRADPFTNAPATHKGLDIAANSGTDILSVMAGVVEEVGYEAGGYGNFVKIRHSDEFYTLYAHCSKITVNKGESVKAGECVAKVGSTGRSTGPHLHFEIIVGGARLDPQWFLSK